MEDMFRYFRVFPIRSRGMSLAICEIVLTFVTIK